jgi:hypothetical protein
MLFALFLKPLPAKIPRGRFNDAYVLLCLFQSHFRPKCYKSCLMICSKTTSGQKTTRFFLKPLQANILQGFSKATSGQNTTSKLTSQFHSHFGPLTLLPKKLLDAYVPMFFPHVDCIRPCAQCVLTSS